MILYSHYTAIIKSRSVVINVHLLANAVCVCTQLHNKMQRSRDIGLFQITCLLVEIKSLSYVTKLNQIWKPTLMTVTNMT